MFIESWEPRFPPAQRPISDLPERLQGLVMPVPWTGCWLFTGRWESSNGYGRCNHKGRTTQIHIATYEELRGEYDRRSFILDHLCKVRPCANPWHLEPVTVRVNTHRGNAKLFAPLVLGYVHKMGIES